jgi:hypothetical protein
MDDSVSPTARPWTNSPTAKEKNAVQRAVTALLDELAPERVLKRAERIPIPIEQHRTPTGCVLQAANSAVSVSWFAEAGADATLGELHIIAWRGVVSRRGSPRRREAATIISELIVRPIEQPLDELVWRTADGAEYDSAGLAARCVALLEQQMRADAPVETPE